MLNPLTVHYANDVRFLTPIDSANVFGRAGEKGDGPFFVFRFKVTEGKIEQLSFECHGCIVARALGSVVCSVLLGKDFSKAAEVAEVGPESLLGGVPEGKGHIAALAKNALLNTTEE